MYASMNNISPISGANYAHKRNEAKRKSETEWNENWEKQRKISCLKRIEHAVSGMSPQRVSLMSMIQPEKPSMPFNNRKLFLPSYHPLHNQATGYIIPHWKSYQYSCHSPNNQKHVSKLLTSL